MKSQLGLLFLVAFVGAAVSSRQKRNVLQFGSMITCTTPRSRWDYCGYGSWCGKGGSGNPVDDTDRCCEEHDRCWSDLKRNRVCRWYTQLVLLTYRYSKGNCDTDDVWIDCMSSRNCKRQLCECDKAAALCFRRSRFNDGYKNDGSCFFG